ncbi:MAG: hypothetical protein O2816_12740, partial [Planctomycetota bacterium]|nr:hypothetical protein [Planctomycetota bacterium]
MDLARSSMNSSAPSNPPDSAGTRHGRRHQALLVDLLEDDSPVVLARVRAEFQRLGRRGAPSLRRAVLRGTPRMRGRARQLLLEQSRRVAVRRLVRY